MTPRIDSSNGEKPERGHRARRLDLVSSRERAGIPRSFFLISLCLLAVACSHLRLPPYAEFVSVRQHVVAKSIVEIYGRYSAVLSGKTIRSRYNLLLDPGKNAYIEILDPAGQLIYSMSLSREEIAFLWAQDGNYIREKATPKAINAITGIPVSPDDLLLLIAGFGLNFEEWHEKNPTRNGWNLSRSSFQARLEMKEEVSKLTMESETNPTLTVKYESYRLMDNRSLPGKIRFEVPGRRMLLELRMEKYIPRDEVSSSDLFALDLPPNARKFSLQEIYDGKPLLMQ